MTKKKSAKKQAPDVPHKGGRAYFKKYGKKGMSLLSLKRWEKFHKERGNKAQLAAIRAKIKKIVLPR